MKQLFKNLATNLPGIQSCGTPNSGYAGSQSTAMGEGGSQATMTQDRFKLTKSGGNLSHRQRAQQMGQDEKRRGCCGGGGGN